MEKIACVGLGELKDGVELLFRKRLKASRRAVDVADNPMLDEILHIWSLGERVSVQEFDDKRHQMVAVAFGAAPA